MSARGGSRLGWWLAVTAVHITLLALFYWPEAKPGLGDERMYLEAATAVVEEGRSGLGSFWPPAYAWFLAPLLALTGGSIWLVQVVQTVLLLAAAWLLRDLVRWSVGDGWTADASALLVVAYPPLAAFAHYLWPEVLHLTLMLAAVWVLVRRGPQLPAAFVGGAILALCLQTKVLLLPLLLPFGLGLWLLWSPGRRLPALLVVAATLAVGVLPTVIAQHRDFGKPMLANSGWFNVWVGLNEASLSEFRGAVVTEEYGRYRGGARSIDRRDRLVRAKIVDLVRDRGLWSTLRRQLSRQYFRLFHRDSFLTQQLRGGAVWERGDGYRAGASPAAEAVRLLSYGAWAGILLLAAWGIAVFPYRGRRFGWWVLGFLAVQCALFLVLHVKTRYRVQMLPAIFFFAAYGAAWWRQVWGRGRRRPSVAHWQWAGGLALGVLLLLLAFGAP